MKIAVCVSGSLRQYKTCLPYFNKYIIEDLTDKGHSVDVFLHLWKFTTNTKNIKHNHKWYNDEENLTDDEIIALYKPKKYIIEEFSDKRMEEIIKSQNGEFLLERTKGLENLDMNSKKGLNERRMVNMYGMHYKIYECNELKKEYEKDNGKYDVVIRTRPDLIFQKPLDFYEKDILNKLVKKKMLMFMTCRSGICDHFFLSTSDIMDQVSCMFLNLTKILKNKKAMTPEQVMLQTISGINKKEYNKCFNRNKFSIHHFVERVFQKAAEYKDLPRLE